MIYSNIATETTLISTKKLPTTSKDTGSLHDKLTSKCPDMEITSMFVNLVIGGLINVFQRAMKTICVWVGVLKLLIILWILAMVTSWHFHMSYNVILFYTPFRYTKHYGLNYHPFINYVVYVCSNVFLQARIYVSTHYILL